tara:strand:+ start:90 stop:389 length:300 start_codon:yes stop_codon:yes gene_type:complete
MIQTKEEMFLAELGINPKEEIKLSYGAKIKITDLLKKYQAEQLILSGVVASILCIDSESFGGLTKDKKYPLIKEDSIHYTIINDFGNEFWYLKKRFIKI